MFLSDIFLSGLLSSWFSTQSANRDDHILYTARRVNHRRGFVAAMNHAIAAARVTALVAVLFPLGRLDQFLKRLRVTVIKQVTRLLPAEEVVIRVAPRRALVIDLAHQEFQEEDRLVELPPLAARRAQRAENLFEKLFGLLAFEKVILIGRPGVAVTGRDCHPVNTEVHHLIEHLMEFPRVFTVEDRRVGVSAESARLGGLDRADRFVESAFSVNALVMGFAQAVEMDIECQVR